MRRSVMWLVRSAVITIAALAVSLPAAVAAQGAHADEHRKFDAVAMGASVMLGAKSHLKAAGVTKGDAVVSRQAHAEGRALCASHDAYLGRGRLRNGSANFRFQPHLWSGNRRGALLVL